MCTTGWGEAADGAAGVAAGGGADPPARVLDCPVKAPPPVTPTMGLFHLIISVLTLKMKKTIPQYLSGHVRTLTWCAMANCIRLRMATSAHGLTAA